MHIVLIRFSSLGDIILQSPFMAWLKLQFPNCKLTFVTLKEFESLVSGHPYVDNIVTVQRLKGADDIRQLRSLAKNISDNLNPDLIIDLHNTLRAKLIRFFCSTTPTIVVDKRSLLRKILVLLKLDFLKKQEGHHTRLIKDFNFLFGVDFDEAELAAFNQQQTNNPKSGLSTVPMSFEKLEHRIEGPYLVISPIASFAPKRWPMEHVKKLLGMLLAAPSLIEYKFVIVAGPNDTYLDELFSENALNDSRIINLQGKTTIAETTQIIAGAELCVTNDTASGHIAEAFGVKALSIFGPTSESFGFRPHLKDSVAVSIPLWCRPCSTTGKKKCMRKEQYCMTQITPQKIHDTIKQMLIGEDK